MKSSLLCLSIVLFTLPHLRADTVAYWRFEEGAANAVASGTNSVIDSSGHGLNGTPVAGPIYRTDTPPGTISNTRSIECSGLSGRRVTVQDSPLLALSHSLTLEAFIKPLPLLPGTGGFGVIIMRGDNRPGLDPYILSMQGPGNIVSFQIINASNQVAFLSAPVVYDQWTHVAGTLDDATGAMKLYVNGTVAASTTTSIRPLGPLDPGWSPGLSLGDDYTGQYGGVFNGLIDEARISDAALLPSQFVPEPATAGSLITLVWLTVGRRRSRP